MAKLYRVRMYPTLNALTLFFFILFYFKLYKIVLVLPNIEINPPQVYKRETKLWQENILEGNYELSPNSG